MSPARRRFVEFIVAIGVLHAIAIAAYYLANVPHAPVRQQRVFGWVWMGLTVAVVIVGLQRIKRARRTGRR